MSDNSAIEWTDTTSPQWRAVPGWACEATSTGELKGPSGQVLKPYVDTVSGHMHVLIRGRKLRVHHAVLFAFGFPRPQGQECRHLDGDPSNNDISNLRWGTRLENRHDVARHGRERRGEAKPNHRLTLEQVKAIRADARSARSIGAEYGVSHTAVLRIRRGERWATA